MVRIRFNATILLELTTLRMPIVENWRLRRRFPECKFIFPNAPSIPITVVCHTTILLCITVLADAWLRILACGCPVGTTLCELEYPSCVLVEGLTETLLTDHL